MSKIRIVSAILIITSLIFAYPETIKAFGVGWCHYFGGLANANVQYIYPGSSLTWAKVEPSEGHYDFSELDAFIQQARVAGKKLHVQFLVSNPNIDGDRMSTVPQWAINNGMHVMTSAGGLPTMPIQWDPLYIRYHENLLKAFATRYEKPEYYDVIEAVVMQSGGNWGEMALPVQNAADQGSSADALNPDNLFVREMARTFLGSESRAGDIARKEGNKWIFDDYFIRAVNQITDLYARSLTHYPFVLQLGYGLTWQERVGREPVEYGISHYGSRMWIRSAAWGSFDMGNNDPNAQDIWGQYQDKTVLVYEAGHPSWWCAAEGGSQKGGCYDCCQWDTKAEAERHNNNYIDLALNSGAVAVCLQKEFFDNPSKYNLDFGRLSTGLLDNVRRRSNLLGSTPPRSLPTSTIGQIPATPVPLSSTTPRGSDVPIRTTPTALTRPTTVTHTDTQPSTVVTTPDSAQNTMIPISVNQGKTFMGLDWCRDTAQIRVGLYTILSLPEVIVETARNIDTGLESTINRSWADLIQKRIR